MIDFDSTPPCPDARPCDALTDAIRASVHRDRVLEAELREVVNVMQSHLATIDGKLDVLISRDSAIVARASRRRVAKVGILAAVLAPVAVKLLELGWTEATAWLARAV